jgi:hypothetical protein
MDKVQKTNNVNLSKIQQMIVQFKDMHKATNDISIILQSICCFFPCIAINTNIHLISATCLFTGKIV